MYMEEPSGTSRPKLLCHTGTNPQKSELAELQFSGRAKGCFYSVGDCSKTFASNDTPWFKIQMEWAAVFEDYFRCKAQRYSKKIKVGFITSLYCWLSCHLGMESGQRRIWSVQRQSIQQPPQKTGTPCFSPRCAQFAFLKVYAWKIQLCTLLSGRTVAVLSLAICHFSSRLRNCSDLEIFLRFFLHPLQSKITDLCSNKSLLEIFREKKE